MTRPFLAIAAAAMLTSIAAWADDADRHKAFNDFLKSRPDKCKEVTARVVQATGGAFKAGGRRDDSIEIAGNPPMTVEIDCGSSDDTISVAIPADGQYPSNRWFAAAAKAGHALTGDTVGDIEKAARRCFMDGMKKPNGYSEADLPKAHFKCFQTNSAYPYLTIEINAP